MNTKTTPQGRMKIVSFFLLFNVIRSRKNSYLVKSLQTLDSMHQAFRSSKIGKDGVKKTKDLIVYNFLLFFYLYLGFFLGKLLLYPSFNL